MTSRTEPAIWSPPAGTRGLIFDCDGTLADTMPVHYRAWTAMLDRHGIPFPETRFYELGGVPTAQIIRILSAEYGVPVNDVDAMVAEKEAAFLANLHAVRPLELVVATAAFYRGRLRLPHRSRTRSLRCRDLRSCLDPSLSAEHREPCGPARSDPL